LTYSRKPAEFNRPRNGSKMTDCSEWVRATNPTPYTITLVGCVKVMSPQYMDWITRTIVADAHRVDMTPPPPHTRWIA